MKLQYRILMNGYGKFYLQRRAVHWWDRLFSSRGETCYAIRVGCDNYRMTQPPRVKNPERYPLEWAYGGQSTALFAESVEAIQALIKLQEQDFLEISNEKKDESATIVAEEIRELR